MRGRLSAISQFTFVIERIARLNASNASVAEANFEAETVAMDELDTVEPSRGPMFHINLANPHSPCCVGPRDPLPRQEALPHDVLLVPDHLQPGGFANDVVYLDGRSPFLLVVSNYGLELLDLDAGSFALEPVSLGGIPGCGNFSLLNSTDLSVHPAVQAVAAWGVAWALVACHALHVFQNGIVTPSQSYGLPYEVECSGSELGQVTLTGSLVVAWRSCPGSMAATLFMASLVDTPSSPFAPTVRTLATHAGACLSCISASGALLAVGGSENCSAGGDVTLWQLSSAGVWLKKSTIVADPHLVTTFGSSHVQGCGFGRVVLLVDNQLFVGIPDAHGGEGMVALYDVSVPEAPELRCEWNSPTGEVRFGSALAIRQSSASPARLLLAVGMDGMVSVQQVYPEAVTGLAVCAGPILDVIGGPFVKDLPNDQPVGILLTPSALVVGGRIPEASDPASTKGAADRGLFITSICEQERMNTSSCAYSVLITTQSSTLNHYSPPTSLFLATPILPVARIT